MAQRERQCHLEAESLRHKQEELEQQLLEYQQNLERLREGQRSMERDRDRVEAEHRLLQSWRHNRQSSLPIMISLDLDQVGGNLPKANWCREAWKNNDSNLAYVGVHF